MTIECVTNDVTEMSERRGRRAEHLGSLPEVGRFSWDTEDA